MWFPRYHGARVAAAALVLLLIGACDRSTVRHAESVKGVPGTFVARFGSKTHIDALGVFDTMTGRRLRDLTSWGPTLDQNGYSRDRAGDIVYSLAHSPTVPNDPKRSRDLLHTCGGSIRRVDHRAGRVSTLLTFPGTQTVAAASISPDGTEVAYVTGGCHAYDAEQYLVVRTVATHRSVTFRIRGGVVTAASWGRGRQIAIAYSFTQANRVQNRYVIVQDGKSQTINSATGRTAIAGCATYNVAFDAAGLITTVGCPNDIGRAQLVQLDTGGRRLSSVRGPGAARSSSLSVAPDGLTVLTGMCDERDQPGTDCYVDVYRGGAVLIDHRYPRDPVKDVVGPVW